MSNIASETLETNRTENRRCRTPKKASNVVSETLETEQKIGAAGRGNTMALKDELVRESH